MHDDRYCYPESDVLINRLNIRNQQSLFEAEAELTFLRLQELQQKPIQGKFDFQHLKAIHRYIFQDVYEWAGQVRKVEIGKGNLFCTTACIQSYAETIFRKYFSQCDANKNDREKFVAIFAENYGDLNALHPFREGNGRSQREFARELCLVCGYSFDLSCTKHEDMLQASIHSFNTGDNSKLAYIFSQAIVPLEEADDGTGQGDMLRILTSDDLMIGNSDEYAYCECSDEIYAYNNIYNAKIEYMKKQI